MSSFKNFYAIAALCSIFTAVCSAAPNVVSTTAAIQTTASAVTTSTSTTSSSSKSTKCQPTTTSTLKFDTLSAGASIPAGAGAPFLSWTGFTVENAKEMNLRPASRPNVAFANAYGAFISSAYTSEIQPMLRSFSFACTDSYLLRDGYVVPGAANCTLLLLAEPDEYGTQIVTYGPFEYVGCAAEYKTNCPMTRIVLNQPMQSQLNWLLIKGPSYGAMYLDDVVISGLNFDGC